MREVAIHVFAVREVSISAIEKLDEGFECLQNEIASSDRQIADEVEDDDQVYCNVDESGVL